MNNLQYNNYIKWKTKYVKLKLLESKLIMEKQCVQNNNSFDLQNQLAGSKDQYDFYITHGTSKLSNLISILANGKIKLGKDVTKEHRVISKGKANKHIYANIYFDEHINLMDNYIDYTIILSPKILEDFDIKFNSGWSDEPGSSSLLEFKTSDNLSERRTKLSEAKKFISTTLKSKPNIKQHELIFDQPIDISKYILGVTCINCDDKNADRFIKIKKMLKRNGRSHVKIITNSKPVLSSYYLNKS